LMIKSFARLLDVSPGFNPENVLSMNVALSGSRYKEPQQVTSFYQRSVERLSSLPGVQSAGATTGLPMAGGFGSRYFRIEGRPPQPAGQGFNANVNLATPGYFQTMNIPFIEGRDFDDRDVLKAPEAVIINQDMARGAPWLESLATSSRRGWTSRLDRRCFGPTTNCLLGSPRWWFAPAVIRKQ